MPKAFNKQTLASRGFTIIEVMIVMAVGGMIMLIVFQAIPTVERNSRNSERKHDVGAILQAVSHYELNHSGNFPDSSSNFLQYTELRHYDVTAVSYDPPTAPAAGIAIYAGSTAGHPASVPAQTNLDVVSVYKYQMCDSDGQGGSTGVGAGYYDTVALYAVQTNNGLNSQCEKL